MKASYLETINYLFSQLPMYQRVGPKAFKKDLTNIRLLCGAIGHPETQIKSIHIAGTNGKGSTAHMLSAILQERGFKTGLYTSPHYKDFRERIKINGEYISESSVVKFVQTNTPHFEQIKPSFFEITVAMAFDYFAKNEVDIAIIETGLGGRLDSTNVVQPLLSVITNISFDHTNFLGNTLPLIATEKAGIIKPKVPVVIGETHPETKPVFLKKAAEMKASIAFADQEYEVIPEVKKEANPTYKIKQKGKLVFENLELDLKGSYQSKNLITALKAIEILDKKNPEFQGRDINQLLAALKNVRQLTNIKGRWEILGTAPKIICDSAHNEDGIQMMMKDLSKIKYNKLHFILGSVFDKPLEKTLPLLPKKAIYYFARPNIPRGMKAEELKEVASEYELTGLAYNTVSKALAAAQKAAANDDLIFIGGSTFVVAEVVK